MTQPQQFNEQITDSQIVLRAKQAVADGDIKYAKFLYNEALAIDPQDVVARKELHNMRKAEKRPNAVLSNLSFFINLCKMLVHKNMSQYGCAIADIEKMLDAKPSSEFATMSMMHIAYDAGYNKLVIFVYDNTKDDIQYELDDMIIIASAYLNEKILDKAAKVAKDATLIDPDNEKAKDILWKASVWKHMNSEASLVTVDGNNRFVPPKIDAEKIFISSHKAEKEKAEKADKNKEQKK